MKIIFKENESIILEILVLFFLIFLVVYFLMNNIIFLPFFIIIPFLGLLIWKKKTKFRLYLSIYLLFISFGGIGSTNKLEKYLIKEINGEVRTRTVFVEAIDEAPKDHFEERIIYPNENYKYLGWSWILINIGIAYFVIRSLSKLD